MRGESIGGRRRTEHTVYDKGHDRRVFGAKDGHIPEGRGIAYGI